MGRDQRIGLGLALLAALPSLAWAVAGADLLTDDFVVTRGLQTSGLVAGMWDLAFEAPARPGAAPYFVVTFLGIGDHPMVQALLMALLNGAAVVVLWRLLARVVSRDAALAAALVFALVPNRGSTRLWFAVGSNLFGLILVGVGAVVLLERKRPWLAGAVLAAAVLTYEGTAGLAGAVVVGWWLLDAGRRTRQAVGLLGILGGAALLLFVLSPKHDVEGPGPFENARTTVEGLLGFGFWGSRGLGTLGALVLLGLVAASASTLAPSLRGRQSTLTREVLIGAGLALAAALPFLVGGAPFAVRGIFDRNNLVPGVGVALVLGAALAALVRRNRPFGLALGSLVLGVLAFGNVQDVRDYRQAVIDGHELVAAILDDVDPLAGGTVVVPPLPGSTGVEQFILSGDLTAALEMRQGPEWGAVAMYETAEGCEERIEADLDAGRAVRVYDRLSREVDAVDDPSACRPAEG